MTSCVHKTQHVSIHASLAGGDDLLMGHVLLFLEFQSTPPSREATQAARWKLPMGP